MRLTGLYFHWVPCVQWPSLIQFRMASWPKPDRSAARSMVTHLVA